MCWPNLIKWSSNTSPLFGAKNGYKHNRICNNQISIVSLSQSLEFQSRSTFSQQINFLWLTLPYVDFPMLAVAPVLPTQSIFSSRTHLDNRWIQSLHTNHIHSLLDSVLHFCYVISALVRRAREWERERGGFRGWDDWFFHVFIQFYLGNRGIEYTLFFFNRDSRPMISFTMSLFASFFFFLP